MSRAPDPVRWVQNRLPHNVSTRQLVLTGATSMIVLQLAFRSWAIYGGWFYGDDLKFLSDAASRPLSLEYLFTRHQQQLMPGGLLISWLVGQGPAWSWSLAATTIVLMQTLASSACALMLVRLFGWRPQILIPLGLYLFSPMTMGAYMWWAAALNQLPLQIAFFALITTHIAFLRTLRKRWALASTILVVVALLFYVKAVIMLPLLALLTLTHGMSGRPRERIKSAVRKFWLVWVGYAAVAIGYLTAYASNGGSPIGGGDASFVATADRQVRQTLGPTLVGGPWRWLDQGRPDVIADAPDAATMVAWLAVVAVVAGTSWRWVGAWRGWLLLGAYLIPTVFLTAGGRTILFGPDVGLYVRYVSDVSVVACLALGLVIMPLLGTPAPHTRRLDPDVSVRPLAWIGIASFLAGSAWSSITYVGFWHRETPAERYIASATVSLAGVDGLSIVDEPVPADLVLGPNAPYDRPSRLLAPLSANLRPVTSGNDLKMFSTTGRLGRPVVTPGISAALPEDTDCAVLIDDDDPRTINLTGTVTDDRWWVAINYLASRDGRLRVTTGDDVEILPVIGGPHTLFLTSTGTYAQITIQNLTPGLGLCVDNSTVGFIGTFN